MRDEMKKIYAALLVSAVVLLPGAQAHAAEPVNSVRCFLVATVYAKIGKDDQKRVAQAAESFYLGRLSGSAATLRPRFAEHLKTITGANSAVIMNECVKAMSERADEIRVMQEALARSLKR
jgi:hypothetical protein